MRALKTAAVFAEKVGLPVHIDTRLMERTFGSLEGQLTRDIMQARGLDPADITTDIMPPDGEQWPETMARADSAIAHWLEKHPADTILFVGHGAFFRALHEVLTGHKKHFANATPYHAIPVSQGQWNLTEI